MNITSQLFIVIAAMCWGATGIVTRPLAAAGFTFFEMTETRSIFASVCLFAFLLLVNRKFPKFRFKDIWIFICMGAIGSALMGILYYYTVETITMAAASVLLYISPYIAIVMSAFIFKEKVTLQKLTALFIAFAGCVMTVGVIDSGNLSAVGILSGIGAAFCFATQTILGKLALMRGYGPITVSAYFYTIAAILLIPFCDLGNMISLIGESGDNLKNLLVLGIFIAVTPSLCYFKGLQKTEPGRALIIAYIEPLTAAVLGFAVFNEVLTPIRILGMALILLSLFILNIQGSSTKNPSVPKN